MELLGIFFGGHFLADRLWRYEMLPCVEAALLLSLSTAIVLSVAAYVEAKIKTKP